MVKEDHRGLVACRAMWFGTGRRVGHGKWSALRINPRGSITVAKNDVRQLTPKWLSSFLTWKSSVESEINDTSTCCTRGNTKAKATVFSAENDTELNDTEVDEEQLHG